MLLTCKIQKSRSKNGKRNWKRKKKKTRKKGRQSDKRKTLKGKYLRILRYLQLETQDMQNLRIHVDQKTKNERKTKNKNKTKAVRQRERRKERKSDLQILRYLLLGMQDTQNLRIHVAADKICG